MHGLLLSVFQTLEQENIQYCLMRDADQLDEFAKGGELDLLVQGSQLAQLQKLLTRLTFVPLPSWGYGAHHFFIAYHQETDCWFKLDVVTEIAYGQPISTLPTKLAPLCLSGRRRFGPTFVLSPECELVTLLLHCVLDKKNFAPLRSQRLQALSRQTLNQPMLDTLLRAYWSPSMTGAQLIALLDAGNWSALLGERKKVAERLAKRDPLGAFSRAVGGRLLRKLNVWTTARRPQSLTVALLAPDGAGKSTLVEGLQDSFYFPVQAIYMGLYQKGKQGRFRFNFPGSGFVFRLLTLWSRYLGARYHQSRRRLVIFDRYIYDSLLPTRQRLSWPKRCRRWLLAHACPDPDLVIMLDVPGELLYARKGEHSAEILEQQRQHYLKLKPYLPQMVVINATQDADTVRREAIALIWRGYVRRQAGLSASQTISATNAHVQATTV